MKLTFHKRIYAPAAVDAAVTAFDGVARVTVTAKGDMLSPPRRRRK